MYAMLDGLSKLIPGPLQPGTYTVVQGTIVIATPSGASRTSPDVPVPLLVLLLILGGLGFLVDLL